MNTTLRNLLFLPLLFLAAFYGSAQNINFERSFPAVTQNGRTSSLGFAGGLNSPQFSSVDFNNDGQEDLFVFDRVGNVAMAFAKDGNGNWQLRPDFLVNFPIFDSWVLLRDYNNDGIQDIFTYNRNVASGIKVYTGSYSPEGIIDFERFNFANDLDIIFIPTAGGAQTQLYVSNIDYPDVADVDCDGDLDVLTFNISGGFLELYTNLSVENGYGQDSLIFILADNCFGGIYESGLSPELDLAASANECANGINDGEVENRHVGSTVLTFDEDGDGDQDLLLGDLSFSSLTMATNGNNCDDAWMTDQDINFPSYDVSAYLPLFPAAFFLDIDGDNKRDLVVTSNEDNIGIDHKNVWYYKNVGTDSNPNFDFRQDDLLVGEMIDLGTRSHPALFDYNADGLQDLVVGNFSFFAELGFKNSRLYLYENTGTASAPAFTLVSDDYLGMAQYNGTVPGTGTYAFCPTFGDLDGDGDVDALVGDIDGKLFYFENTAGEGQLATFAPATYGYMGIDIGQAAVPLIVDLNRDGLSDIVIGEKTGNLNYFQNIGTVGSPMFGQDEEIAPNVRQLGQVDTRVIGSSVGYAAPFFVDINGEYHLFVGSQSGALEYYRDIEGNLDGAAFNLVSENLLDQYEGIYTHPILWDWNGNDFFDLVLGNERGGVSFFGSNLLPDGTVNTEAAAGQIIAWEVYPNPVNDQLFLNTLGIQEGTLRFFDQQGRVLWESAASTSLPTQLDVSRHPAGLYFLQLRTPEGSSVKKIVVE
jgi:hypothetical protein